MKLQKIRPCIWFKDQAEEAMNFYLSVFKDSKQDSVIRCGPGGPGPEGSVLVANFEIHGHQFMVLNGNTEYKNNPAISFSIDCENQEEVDFLWKNLSMGGKEMPCSWVEDKYGICWQIVPNILTKYMLDKDPAKAERVMKAMMKMTKIIISDLEKAYYEQ